MNILYYDNCWFTNVGEAFIDIGAINIVKKLFPEAHIANISNMSGYYVPNCENTKSCKEVLNYELINTLKYFEFDYLVLAGMFMTKQHLEGVVSKFVKESVQQGKKIIFLGLGMESEISSDLLNEFKQYLYRINPILITTRDKKTFQYLSDIENVVQGIDAAFWVKDDYDPRGFSLIDYDVVCFCRSNEPEMFNEWYNPIIRPYHFQFNSQKRSGYKKNTFISDIPYDYITLYANAHKVYTDLVHATIIALQYGKEVEYFYIDNRSDAFLDLPFLIKENKTIRIEEKKLEEIKGNLITIMLKTITK